MLLRVSLEWNLTAGEFPEVLEETPLLSPPHQEGVVVRDECRGQTDILHDRTRASRGIAVDASLFERPATRADRAVQARRRPGCAHRGSELHEPLVEIAG